MRRWGDWHGTALRVKELCERYGIRDRMPRPIIPGDKRALNKRIVEALANQCHGLELDNAPGQRVWAYRKAAWAIEALRVEQDVGLIYRQMGRKGLDGVQFLCYTVFITSSATSLNSGNLGNRIHI